MNVPRQPTVHDSGGRLNVWKHATAAWLGFFAVWLLLVPGLAHARDRAAEAYAAGDFVRAYKLWRPLAGKGDREAQFGVGSLYEHGQGVAPNSFKAVEWYRKAAERGHTSAQFNLGNMYADGGAQVDFGRAVYWLTKAAEQGLASAQFNLAMKYHHVPQFRDHAKAAEWYRKAADQNHLSATVNLGALTMSGLGVAKDDARAVELYRKAAEQGHAQAQTYLGDMYAWGRGINRDDSEAVAWHRKSAAQGEFKGLLNIAFAYAKGIGVPKDLVLAYVFATHDPKYRKIDLSERTKLADVLKGRLTDEQRAEAAELIAAWTSGKPMPATSRTGR